MSASEDEINWPIEFFETDTSTRPVEEWLDSLSDGTRGAMLARINLLRKEGPTLDYPYTSQIEGKLRELRWRTGKTRYRVLYYFDSRRTVILLHGFTKNTSAVEPADKRIGMKRMDAHEARLKGRQRR